jgi:group I intron endonuclease
LKTHNFVYITTNLINGKQYVGSHATNKLNDGYLGSGMLILKAVQKYGKSNFKIEIIKNGENILDMRKLEEFYIIKNKTLIPYGYNISPKGGLGFPGADLHESTKKKIGDKNRGKIRSEETKLKLSIINKGVKSGKSHPLYGKHHTPETLKRISENRKGKTTGKNHHYFGKTRDDETKKKIKESLTGQRTPEEVKIKLSNASKNVKKVKCEHCNKYFTPWGLSLHKKALLKKNI